MDLLQALFAGIIQGITEFLPVSSFGHLVIFHTLFGESDGSNLAFTVFMHLATLLSVMCFVHIALGIHSMSSQSKPMYEKPKCPIIFFSNAFLRKYLYFREVNYSGKSEYDLQ